MQTTVWLSKRSMLLRRVGQRRDPRIVSPVGQRRDPRIVSPVGQRRDPRIVSRVGQRRDPRIVKDDHYEHSTKHTHVLE